jgi:hypothetical protein
VLSFWRQILTANKVIYIPSSERYHHIQEFIKSSGNLGKKKKKKKKKATNWVWWRKKQRCLFHGVFKIFFVLPFFGWQKVPSYYA